VPPPVEVLGVKKQIFFADVIPVSPLGSSPFWALAFANDWNLEQSV